jgi:YD repeat-containing protein
MVGYHTAMHYGPNSEFPPHQPLYHSLHLVSRTEVASGNMWFFAYVDGQGGEVTSTVTLPDSGVTTYLHMREPDGVYVGRMYLDHAVTCNKAYGLPDPPPVCAGTTYGWKTLDPVGQELGIDPSGNGEGAYIENPAPQLIAHAFAFRDGRTFATHYHYCGEPGEAPCNEAGHGALNDFGNPASVHETGDFERTTVLTYRHAFGAGVYLRGVPVSQAVTVGTETFTTTDTYNDSGFLMTRDVFGIATTYAPTSAGQVASLTDARQFTTTLTWDWGVRATTVTPEYTVQRTVNPDGTVQSVTQNGATTTFEYDALGRQTRIHPPVGHDT